MATNTYQKAAQLLITLEKQGVDVYKFRWALTTGRLDINTEWAIIQFVKAGNLAETYEALSGGYTYLQSLKTATVEELTTAGWMPQAAKKVAKIIAQSKIVQNVD